jgi:hypothetical protein
MLHYFRTILAKVKVKLQEADGIQLGNVEIKIFTLFRKVAYNHAKVKESPPYKMGLLVNLNFHNEPGTCGIFAIDIKHGIAVKLCFAKLLAIHNANILNRTSQLFGEKRIEQEQKPFRALLVSKSFLESEVQSKRSELRMLDRFNRAGFASFTHGHNTSFKGDKVNGPRILYKKSGSYAVCNSLNIEKLHRTVQPPRSAFPGTANGINTGNNNCQNQNNQDLNN